MKNFLFTTAVAFALMAAPVFACDTQPIANSNATQKVDPNCQFADNLNGESILFISVDADDDVTTPSVPGVALSKTPDFVALFN